MEAAGIELARAGYTILRTKPAFLSLPSTSRKPSFPVDVFAQQLLTLLRAGLGLVSSLEALAREGDERARAVIEPALEDLRAGKRFADALERTNAFPDLFIALVRASEHTSDLPTALDRYLQYDTQTRLVRQKIVSSALYPVLLTGVGILVVAFLLLFVMPRFAKVFESLRGDLPWAAQAMLGWSRMLEHHSAPLAAIAILAVAAIASLAGTSRGRAWALRHLFAVPRIGAHLRLLQLARMYRTLGMLVAGGIPLLRALGMSAALLPAHMGSSGDIAIARIREGARPSDAMRAAALTTPAGDQLLLVGERGGELGSMMTRVAEFYESETALQVERFMKVLEPALMLAIGLGIGIIVVLMYMPIFELAGAIQ